MSSKFSADEVYEMAEQIERNGAAFYRKAAAGFDDASIKDMLHALAAMEDEHEKTFQGFRATLKGSAQSSPTFDPDDLAVQYLQAMAGGYVFDTSEPADKLSGKETLEEVLRFAIGLERDSIAFYVGLKEVTPDTLGKEKIDWVIKQEIQHINTLSSRLKQI